MPAQSTLTLGPLSFRTIADAGPGEALGDTIEVVGAALTAADPAPKPFSLAIPVGWAGEGAYEEGMRARRQVRGLLNNARARTQGLSLRWTVDDDWHAWLLVGGGSLEPGSAGGITHGEWTLRLNNCFVVGRRATHRPAIQATVIDMTRGDVARDVRRTVYSTDFAWCAVRSRVALGLDVTDVIASGRPLAALPDVPHRDGAQTVVEEIGHGQIVSFEDDSDRLGDSVAILDRRGSVAETDWERVFGADHPLTPGDVPTLDNGLCRTRWLAGALALDSWDGSSWQERVRVAFSDPLTSVRVEEWTPERAVLALTTVGFGRRQITYVTLQRGWHGPSIERYQSGAIPQLLFVSVAANQKTFRQPRETGEYVRTGNPLPESSGAAFAAQNWAELDDGTAIDAFAVRRASTSVRHGASSLPGLTGSRSSVTFSDTRYVGVHLALRRADRGAGATLGAFALADTRAVPTLVART